jgi:hypothetical protein
MRVEVYFNLHKRLWSVRQCSTGRVILHTDKVHIRDAKFVVHKAGRERVLREGKKNVHAFVRGEATHFDDFDPDYLDYTLVSYNPYKHDTFVDVCDVRPVRTAKRAVLEVRPCLNLGEQGSPIIQRGYLYAEGARA